MRTIVKKLIYKAYTILLVPLWPINGFLINKYSKSKIKHQPVFIVGSPRTGSTVLYQALTNQSDVLYFDNLTCRLNRIVFLGFWLSNKIYGKRAHNCFRSVHGNTSRGGGHAPSECGGFWYRWLPTDRHFINYEDLDYINCEQIKKEITAVTNYFDRPIVFKNLNSGQRLRLLNKLFPKAKIVFIRRENFYTAQSVLLSKRKLGIPDNKFWSIMPRNVKELENLEWADQIARQIYYLEEQILKDSKLFPKANCFEIDYLGLNQGSIDKLSEMLGLQARANYNNIELRLSQKTIISKKDKDKLVKAIERAGS